MNTKPLFILAAAIAVCATVVPQHASAAGSGTLTNQIYNDSGAGGNYTNASSITVPSTLATDILFGASALATNYVGNNEANGGTTAPLTDGQTASSPSNLGNASINPSEGTSASNALFDLGAGPQPWYVEYQLSSPVDLASVIVTSGHQDFRVNQVYDILVSTDGTTFTSLSDGSTTTTLGGAGSGFNYSPSTGNGGAAQSTVSPISGNSLATNVNYIEFVDQSAGADIYRELSATSNVPEPTSALLAASSAGLLGFRRNRRTA